jgi:hypothetical protein
MQSNDEYVRHSIRKMEHPPIFKYGEVKDHPYFCFNGFDEKDRLLYRCKLCEVGRLPVYKLEHHCEENERFFKQCLLREDVRRALLVAERATQILADPLYAKIQALPKQIPAAIDAVHAEFYRYLIAPAADNERDENGLLDRPLKKLKACFQSEALMLLALAVWKAQCLQQMPPNDEAARDWIQSGWKSSKAQQSHSNAMEIILTSVRPFLNWSQWNHVYS